MAHYTEVSLFNAPPFTAFQLASMSSASGFETTIEGRDRQESRVVMKVASSMFAGTTDNDQSNNQSMTASSGFLAQISDEDLLTPPAL